jgi:hypothetical protein
MIDLQIVSSSPIRARLIHQGTATTVGRIHRQYIHILQQGVHAGLPLLSPGESSN